MVALQVKCMLQIQTTSIMVHTARSIWHYRL